jgi:hypothetical protein
MSTPLIDQVCNSLNSKLRNGEKPAAVTADCDFDAILNAFGPFIGPQPTY